MHTRSLHAVLLSALLLTGAAFSTSAFAQQANSEMPSATGLTNMAPQPSISSGVLTGGSPINMRPGAFIVRSDAYQAQRQAEMDRANGAANSPYNAYLQSQNKTSASAYNAQLARQRSAQQATQGKSLIPSPFPAGYGQ